jgi:hypothetical protein
MRLLLTTASRRVWAVPALIAALAFVLAIASIDPAGEYPAAPQGPGLTVDETFNVQEGVRLVHGLYNVALGGIGLRDVFGDQKALGNQPPVLGYHNPDHPPFGRLWLGLFHQLSRWVAPPREHETPFATVCARTGSAAAFAITVFLVSLTTMRWYGPRAGLIAGVSLVLMPRVFGHARLAALETTMDLTYLVATFTVAAWWTKQSAAAPNAERLPWRTAAFTGALWGVALLTKIQGVLLIVPVAIWALCQWRKQALVPLVIWGLVGWGVFFVAWPWLWFDPLHNLLGYLRSSTQRSVLYVWYFGERFADRDVPWHFPWVMFAATVPVGLHLLGLCGVIGGERPAWKERREQLLLGAMFFPLVLFSLSRIAVYDGERLFLVSFPLWAMLIGRGGAVAWSWLEQCTSVRIARALAMVFLAMQGYGLIANWPCHLSYYNVLVGGPRGAERLGLECNYWGDGLTRDLLEATVELVPEGARIDVAPVLHQFQLEEMLDQSPILRRRRFQLVPFDETKMADTRYVLLFRRKADLPPSLRTDAPPGRLLAEVTRQGVQLAALYEWRASERP